MSSSFAAMTPFCGQYAPLTASAKWSQESFAVLLFSAASWLHLATLACICLRLSPGYTCVTCLRGAGTCGIHTWPLRASQMLQRPCGGRFYCQLCYILIKSSLSTISLCQIGFLISANVRINKILQANYTLSHFFLQSPQSCPKSIKLVIMRKPIFLRPECIVLRIKLQKIYWFSP